MLATIRTRLRTRGLLRLLLAAAAVPAILTGLLAMHVLSGAGSTPEAAHHAGIVTPADAGHSDHTHHADAAQPASGEHAHAACGAGCGSEHDMVMIACMLALLVAAFTMLTLAALRRHTWLLPPTRILHGLIPDTTAPLRPPSLLELSISRT